MMRFTELTETTCIPARIGTGPGLLQDVATTRRARGSFLKAFVAVSTLLILVAGCGQQDSGDAVSGMRVNAPLESPAWSPQEGSVFAIRQADRSLVKVDVTPGGITQGNQISSTVSEQLSGIGENFAPDLRESGRLYVPQPEGNRVMVVGAIDLANIRSFEAGPSPSRLALSGPTTENSGVGDTLLALSRDGSTVTGVSLDSFTQEFQREIDVGTGVLLKAAESGGRSFWAAGSEGVTFYDGSALAGLPSNLELDVGALATDPENAGQAFVGEASSGRLHSISVDPAGGLRVTDEADLGSDAEQLAISDGLLYAATSDALIALEPQSLDVVYRAEFGEPMREAVTGRPTPSGITFSEDNAYLTLEGSPFVVEVGKRE